MYWAGKRHLKTIAHTKSLQLKEAFCNMMIHFSLLGTDRLDGS